MANCFIQLRFQCFRWLFCKNQTFFWFSSDQKINKLDLQGWLPSYLIDQVTARVLLDYVTYLRSYVDKLNSEAKQQAD